MLTVNAITIEGFRGFPKAVSFNFDSPVTLLIAENHQGKSSVMNAIEWCLFGEDCVGGVLQIKRPDPEITIAA